MPARSVVAPALAAIACGVALLAFIVGHELHLGTFRIYSTTDVMPLKETLFFVAMALFGTAATWFGAMALDRAAGFRLRDAARFLGERPVATVAALAGLGLLATALVSWLALQHTAVVLDEDLYRFQVDLLRAGKLYTTPPRPLGPFREFYSVQTRGVWTGIYPWGHIAMLLPGYVLNFPQLVPHLCAGAMVVLTYLLGKELFPEDKTTPLLAAGFVALSPFVAFTCGTTHNSTTSMAFVNLGLWALVRSVRRDAPLFAILAGLAFGAGLHSRPLNSVAVAVACGVIALVMAVRTRRRWWLLAAGFIAGVLPGLAAYFLINKAITGDPMMTPAVMSVPTKLKIFGFDGTVIAHTPLLAFGKSGTNLIRLTLWTTGSTLGAIALVAFLGGLRRRTSDLVLLAPVLAVFSCYYFYFTSPGSDTGPLYYADLVPALALVIGRTLVALGDRLPEEGHLSMVRSTVVMSFVVALGSFWPMQGIAGHHVTDNNLQPYRAVERAGLHNAIVWFNRSPRFRSWKLTPIPPKPDLSDDVLYARYDEKNAVALWDKYGTTRSFYTLIFDPDKPDDASIEPWFPASGQ